MLRRTRFLSFLLVAFMVPGLSGAAWAADAPKLLGKYDDWEAYTFGVDAARTCFVLSTPKTRLPASVARGNVYFSVTHRPAQKIRNEVSMRVGFPYAATSKPFATIGKTKYQMLTGVSSGGEQRNWAWLDNPKQEPQMVQAMRSGSSMVIKGKSDSGKLVTDTYSLKGSGAALDKINEACK